MLELKWPSLLAAALAGAGLLLAAASCTSTTEGEPEPDPEPIASEGLVGDEGVIQSADGRLDVEVTGERVYNIRIQEMNEAPGPPSGWTFLTPVYDITARETDGAAVEALPAPFRIRFLAPPSPSALVLVHNDNWWEVVPTARDNQSALFAVVDHLTPYVLAAPVDPRRAPTPIPPVMRPTPRPTATPTPEAGSILVNTPTPLPPTPTPTSPSRPPGPSGQTTLSAGQSRVLGEAHLEVFKGVETDTFGAMGYLDQTVLPLPPTIEATIAQLAMGWGFYGGANEFFASAGTGRDLERSMVVLIEPRTRLPEDAAAAKELLRALFPGAAGQWDALPSGSGGFTFTGPGPAPTVVETAGFAISEGLVMAYFVSAGGPFAELATALADATP